MLGGAWEVMGGRERQVAHVDYGKGQLIEEEEEEEESGIEIRGCWLGARASGGI
jgi:hypothetical protein